VSLGLVMALSVSRLGQGQAREAGTEKSDVSGANLSRAQAAAWSYPRRVASASSTAIRMIASLNDSPGPRIAPSLLTQTSSQT
jgi:hypothetical protein